ncbi:hypothetical protein [Streptomyces sp. NPDC002845]
MAHADLWDAAVPAWLTGTIRALARDTDLTSVGDRFTCHVLFDLVDSIDDFAVHPALRNDLGLLRLVTLDRRGVRRTEAVPLALDHCHTRLADSEQYDWMADRLTHACAKMGTHVTDEGERLAVTWACSVARAC